MPTLHQYACHQCGKHLRRDDPVVEAEQVIDGLQTGSAEVFHESTCWPPKSHSGHDWHERRRGPLSKIRPNAAE